MAIAANVVERAIKTITERHLADQNAPIMLMVSGGSDSTALAYIASVLRDRNLLGPVGIVHVNHNLRQEASDGDSSFVKNLAASLNIPLYSYSIDVGGIARESGENLEAVARRERYAAAVDALARFCDSVGYPRSEGRIFTAHTRNDRVENFFMRSIVGTGPGGFRSMLYENGTVVRPLLDIERDELREYLKRRELDVAAGSGESLVCDESGMLWREDATNAHTDQFRGYVRHEIVPKALQRNPRLLEVLCRTMNLIADEDDMLEEQAISIVEKNVRWNDMDSCNPANGCVVLPAFAHNPVPLQRRAMANILQSILGPDARIETRSIEEALAGFEGGKPISGFAGNIQGNLALSANKKGLRIEPMVDYRERRKRK